MVTECRGREVGVRESCRATNRFQRRDTRVRERKKGVASDAERSRHNGRGVGKRVGFQRGAKITRDQKMASVLKLL
jgi:hypothetical protein